MAPIPIIYIAFTAPINPESVSPALTVAQVWEAMKIKIHHPQEFVGGAIINNEIVGTSTDQYGREVITREVVFKEGNRKATEVCTLFEGVKVEFEQPDGSKVLNIISVGAEGELYMTFQFEWMQKDVGAEELKKKEAQYKKMAQMAVEKTISAARDMAKEGKI